LELTKFNKLGNAFTIFSGIFTLLPIGQQVFSGFAQISWPGAACRLSYEISANPINLPICMKKGISLPDFKKAFGIFISRTYKVNIILKREYKLVNSCRPIS
jgi:hypothetical protein